MDIQKLLDSMTLDDLCGQVLCYYWGAASNWSDEEFKKIVAETKPGGIFVGQRTKDEIKWSVDMINKHTKVPVIVSCDAENGPGGGGPFKDEIALPQPMAWGACDDEKLIEKAGRVTAQMCRKKGIHWNFAPIVDINYNSNNPVTNIRAISDSPNQVSKIATSYLRGIQQNGLMGAGCKHFPGDGIDDRNQHFCTTINSMSRDEWMNTYGYVYKKMFEEGAVSVMVAHIAAPAFQEDEYDEVLGYKPATLSYKLMTKLLKEELGFKGCVVSDAMSMVGACSMVDPDKLAVEFIKSGGDMVLFALPDDFNHIKNAVLDGIIPIERLKDAVRRILEMKMAVRLFENQDELTEEIVLKESIEEIAERIADKSINIVRNAQNILPVSLNKGDKVLICNIQRKLDGADPYSLDTIRDELIKRGFEVSSYINPGHRTIEKELAKDYDCILVNCRLSPRDYNGGSLRYNWEHIAPFWRGKILTHPRLVFTSFGDPYKLYEFPFVKTYVNTFSNTIQSQKAFVKVLLGEIPAVGKSPVKLDGYIKREVD